MGEQLIYVHFPSHFYNNSKLFPIYSLFIGCDYTIKLNFIQFIFI